jgi:hypothetical protein
VSNVLLCVQVQGIGHACAYAASTLSASSACQAAASHLVSKQNQADQPSADFATVIISSRISSSAIEGLQQ